MSREEIKRIFFELLTEDEEFKQKLTEFILSAVAEKFVERVAQNVEPPKSEEVAQEKFSPEFIQKVVEQSDLDKQRGEKELAESQRDELQTKCDKLTADKKVVESQRDELQTKFDKLSDDKKFVESQRDELQDKFDKLSNDKKFVESQRDELQDKFDKLSNDKKFVESQRDALKIELDKIRGNKKSVEDERDGLKIELDKLRGDKKSVEGERDDLQAKCDKLIADKRIVENQRDELQTKCDKLATDKRIVEGERDELNRQLETVYREKESAEKQLAERFAKGWDVYQSFLKLNAEVRENSGFYAERFETFICKGAQYKSLDGIWEAALGCKRDGKIDDAEIFWDVFEYFVKLVNFAFGDNFIEILNTQTGERYNTDIHSTSGTNSSTQGVVREVILAGYKNNNNRKIVKKSNVRVG